MNVVHLPTVNVTRTRSDPHLRRCMWIDGAVVLFSVLLTVYLSLQSFIKQHLQIPIWCERREPEEPLWGTYDVPWDRIIGCVFHQWLLRENMLFKNYATLRVPFWPHSVYTPKFLPSLPFQNGSEAEDYSGHSDMVWCHCGLKCMQLKKLRFKR